MRAIVGRFGGREYLDYSIARLGLGGYLDYSLATSIAIFSSF